jgi:hypothetical protein
MQKKKTLPPPSYDRASKKSTPLSISGVIPRTGLRYIRGREKNKKGGQNLKADRI